MYEKYFSKWFQWQDRNNIEGISFPGVYVCILSKNKKISGEIFTWSPDVIYIGMTNSIYGIKGRLKQFDNTILGKNGHGGADRVRYRYQNYNDLVNHLYVSISYLKCNVKSNNPEDLRIMGEVCKFEYECLAGFVEKFGRLPEFNDKKNSPKYSLTIGRS